MLGVGKFDRIVPSMLTLPEFHGKNVSGSVTNPSSENLLLKGGYNNYSDVFLTPQTEMSGHGNL